MRKEYSRPYTYVSFCDESTREIELEQERPREELFAPPCGRGEAIDWLVATHSIFKQVTGMGVLDYLKKNFPESVEVIKKQYSESGFGYHTKRRFFGLTKTKIYGVWEGIKRRCLNADDKSYADYGGRGIDLAPQFKDFWVFMDYMKTIEGHEKWVGGDKSLSIDRIDNDKGYWPGNIRLTDRSTQAHNTRHRQGSTGSRGVKKNNESQTYNASIMVRGVRHHIGSFKTVKAAAQAREEYIKKNHPSLYKKTA